MRPDSKLQSLLGLTAQGSTTGEGYLKVDTRTAPGTGITGETIQFHGAADRYTASGVDLKQRAGAGFDAVRLACTIPFVGSNGTTAEFDQLMLTDPGPLDAGRRRRIVTLG